MDPLSESQAFTIPAPSSDVGTPFKGYICTTGDALLVVEATRRGIIPHVNRRLNEPERKSCVQSGSVFVYSQRNSDIKRWTDSRLWSPSRILGNFLLYRETSHRQRRGIKKLREAPPNWNKLGDSREVQFKRWVVGSFHRDEKFKPGGLLKKTISVTMDGITHHLVSYYTVDDVLKGRLNTPSNHPVLSSVVIPREMLGNRFRTPIAIIDGPVPTYGGVAGEPSYDDLHIPDPLPPAVEEAIFTHGQQSSMTYPTAELTPTITWSPQRLTRYEPFPSNAIAISRARHHLAVEVLPPTWTPVSEPPVQLPPWQLDPPLTLHQAPPYEHHAPTGLDVRSCLPPDELAPAQYLRPYPADYPQYSPSHLTDQLVIPNMADYYLMTGSSSVVTS